MSLEANKLSLWDRVMMAITFAEAGEHKTAVELLNRNNSEKQKEAHLRKNGKRPELRA